MKNFKVVENKKFFLLSKKVVNDGKQKVCLQAGLSCKLEKEMNSFPLLERERERECVYVWERERERKNVNIAIESMKI